MKLTRLRGATGNILLVFLPDSTSTTGAGKTGLTNASAGLLVSVRRELSAATSNYSGSNIETISTLGTWADPTTGKCRFKEVDATNMPGVYELQFVDSVFGAGDASRFVAGMVTATGVAPTAFEVELVAVDLQSITAIPDAIFKRDLSAITGEAARSLLNAVRFLRNKWTLTGTTLSVKKEDDTTEAWTATVTTSSGADPITGSDPA